MDTVQAQPVQPIKPGIKTTELYVTLIVTMIVGFGVSHGVIDVKYADALTQAAMICYGGFITMLPGIVFIISRTWLKVEHQRSQQVLQVQQ